MRRILIYILLLFLPGFLYSIVGTDFLLIKNSAEIAGRGGTGSGKYSYISSVIENPASSANNNMPQISLSHLMLHNNNMNYEYIGVGFPVYNNMFSLHFIYLYLPDTFELIGGEETGNTINYNDTCILLSDSLKIKDLFSAGLSLKYIKREIADISATTFSFDFGIIKDFSFFNLAKKIYNNCAIGFALKNLGGSIKFIQTEEKLPLSYSFGLSYSPYPEISFLYDINKIHLRKLYHLFGIEYKTPFLFDLRTGLKFEEETVLMSGIGIRQRIGYVDIKADYAINLFGQAVKNHTISLNIVINPVTKIVVKTNVKKEFVEKHIYVPIAINTNKKITKIAVTEFENISKINDLEYLRKTIPESISTFLGKYSELKIMDNDTVNMKLKALSVKLEDFDTLEKQILLGKILGVDSIIKGSFIEEGNEIQINTKLIDIKSGTIITSDQIKGDINKDMFLLLDKTSRNILTQISNINNASNY